MQPPSPAEPKGRIIQLDALRGLAVIGIVWMNVYIFALPAQAYYNPLAAPMQGGLDQLVWIASFVFVEDKFRTLFAMLFGVGCLILLEKGGRRRWRAHFSRMAVLFAIGLAHSIVLASNDVLRVYALAGLALPVLAHLRAHDLYAIAIGLVVFHCAAGLILFGVAVVDFYDGRLMSNAYLSAERQFGRDPAALAYAMELGREALTERIGRRFDGIPSQLFVLIGAIPLNLGAMCLGMALWKDRILAGEWRLFKLQRLSALCAVIAIPALLLLALWVSSHAYPGALVGMSALLLSAPFDTLLGLAYAALAMAFFQPSGFVTQRLAVVGRLSLTNYLMSSLVLAAIFASWGLGLFGQLTRAQSFAISFVPIAAMLVWSPIWLSHFGQGPAERVWRKAAEFLS